MLPQRFADQRLVAHGAATQAKIIFRFFADNFPALAHNHSMMPSGGGPSENDNPPPSGPASVQMLLRQ